MGIMRVSVALLFLSLSPSLTHKHTLKPRNAENTGSTTRRQSCREREKEGKESERVVHSKQSLGYHLTPSMVSGIRVITRNFGNFDQI